MSTPMNFSWMWKIALELLLGLNNFWWVRVSDIVLWLVFWIGGCGEEFRRLLVLFSPLVLCRAEVISLGLEAWGCRFRAMQGELNEL